MRRLVKSESSCDVKSVGEFKLGPLRKEGRDREEFRSFKRRRVIEFETGRVDNLRESVNEEDGRVESADGAHSLRVE